MHDWSWKSSNVSAPDDSGATLRRACRINIELEAFSYSLSHDLRAPLRAIDGFAQMLCDSGKTKLDATEQDYLRRVKTSAKRMNLLIGDMLKLFRMSRHEMRQTTIDLSIHSRKRLLRTLAARRPSVESPWSLRRVSPSAADASLMRIAFGKCTSATRGNLHATLPILE